MKNPGETTISTFRVSIIPAVFTTVILALLGVLMLRGLSGAFQSFIDATVGFIPWTQSGVVKIYHIGQIAVFAPALLGVLRIVVLRQHVFELTSERLFYRRGILRRRADQVALERIRDFSLAASFPGTLIGLGRVCVISRDETLPELWIGPVRKPEDIAQSIRAAVLERQTAVGFREFETT